MIVRSDLPVGVIAAQTIHAAGESAALRAPSPGCHAVALSASERELLKLELKLRERKVPHVPIREPDSPYLGALVAIGIPPGAKGASRLVRHLRLVGREGSHVA